MRTAEEILRDIVSADAHSLQGYIEEAKLLYPIEPSVDEPAPNCLECYFLGNYGKCEELCRKLKAHKVQAV